MANKITNRKPYNRELYKLSGRYVTKEEYEDYALAWNENAIDELKKAFTQCKLSFDEASGLSKLDKDLQLSALHDFLNNETIPNLIYGDNIKIITAGWLYFNNKKTVIELLKEYNIRQATIYDVYDLLKNAVPELIAAYGDEKISLSNARIVSNKFDAESQKALSGMTRKEITTVLRAADILKNIPLIKKAAKLK